MPPRHRKLVQLGKGGMAHVWLGLSSGPAGFQKLVVVKELRPELARDAESRRMFLDEARLAARLSHPNVVQTLEAGETEEGDLFLVMEYLDGQSLRSIHRRRRPPLPMEVRVVSDMLAGLHHAHELRDYDGTPLGVVHRDVSPHNVFVTYEGHVKVVDFGIAQARSSTETAGALLKGKLAYMPPEQARGQRVDRRADVFAAGVMLWECLAGRRLWAGLAEATLLYRLGAGDVPDVGEHAPDAPPELVDACRLALAADPAARLPTAAALRDRLEAWLRRQPDPVRRNALGGFVSELFSEERARIQALLEAQLRPPRPSGPPRAEAFDVELHTDELVAVGDASETPGTHPRARLEGPYRVGRVLARSPRALVVEGEHGTLGHPVVLKYAEDRAGAEPDPRARRVALAGSLVHPATVRIVDVLEAGAPGAPDVIVRERVDGADLGEVLRATPRLEARRALRLLDAVARSLAEAHDRGLVHGRLDPSHVMVGPDGLGGEAARVLGYEEAPWTAATEAEGGGWIAPEVAAGADPDPRADLYAVGALLRVMLLGPTHQRDEELPPDERSERRRLASIPSLQELLGRALAPRASDRPASAEEMLADLARVARDVGALGALEPSAGSPRGALAPGERGTGTLRVRDERLLSLARPTIWALDDDPAMRHGDVRAALERVAARHPVRWLGDAERVRLADALLAGTVDPPWVVVFGDQHVLRGERLLAELAVSAEVSRCLVSTHPDLERLDATVNAAGLDRQIVLPAGPDEVLEAVRALIERTRAVRRRYDALRFTLREARERLAELAPTPPDGP